MDEYLITDLKQFITEAINRQTLDIYQGMADMRRSIIRIEDTLVGMRQDINHLDERVGALERKIDDLDRKLDATTQAMSEAVEDIHGGMAGHDRRLKHLELGYQP